MTSGHYATTQIKMDLPRRSCWATQLLHSLAARIYTVGMPEVTPSIYGSLMRTRVVLRSLNLYRTRKRCLHLTHFPLDICRQTWLFSLGILSLFGEPGEWVRWL